MTINKKKLANLLFWGVRIAVVIFGLVELYLRFTTGRQMSHVLLYLALLLIPAKIRRMVEDRNARAADPEAVRQYDRIVIRSILISILLVALFVTVVVLLAINR